MNTITELPDALKPWSPWLDWFAPEMAAELGALVQRMQPLLGRFRGRTRGGAPEPEGLDDLRRRGPYERLLATEWLLADELPDEFLRRAASSEHLFLAPRPRAREAEKSIVAIFDAGPRQFGAPRLGQLALWILLARRAAQIGGVFQWGVLQLPGGLDGSHDAKQLRSLLRARDFDVATPAHESAWREVLAGLDQAPGESWLVGAAPAEQPADERWTSHRVCLQRAVLGDVLDVSLSDSGGPRRAQLPLPSAKVGVPLLRGEFTQRASTILHRHHRGRISLQRPPVISPSGTHVAVQLLDEPGMLVFAVPPAGQRKAAKPKYQYWSQMLVPLAVLLLGKRAGALLSYERSMYFWQVPGLGNFVAPDTQEFRAPPGLAVWLSSAWLHDREHQRVCMIDRDGKLVIWNVQPGVRPNPESGAPTLVESKVVGMLQWSELGVVYLAVHDNRLVLQRLGASGGPAPIQVIGTRADETRVLFANAWQWRNGVGGVALRVAARPHEVWRIHQPDPASAGGQHGRYPQKWKTFEVRASRAEALIDDSTRGRYALLSLSPSLDGLDLHAQDGIETIYKAPERIERISVCPGTGLAVMLTVHKKIIVYAVPQRSLRAVLHGEGASSDATPA
ncbi:UNVERIFIED_ORG: hypothetical protein J2W38_003036 [Variovorax paradoxus]|nr:hypothetical protein [Variovorax paradoxus]